ncbi:hypothetical protein STA1M1_14290 [Sinisalibacter aestuarii]|uniref:Uncharacterized protein n=1 Tax=Sinisalibacter aestuarii TaxID=2949426 RepID=A0ABQ5LRB8_9RHOB|nr:hypothetical protein STA1M1_14290 [Sinisalibacter aestuarii]
MTNGSNGYGVTLPQIRFISKLLHAHRNVEQVTRTNDIQFDLMTSRGVDLRLICVNEYTCGLAKVLEVLEDFPGTNIIYVGGAWNGYTMQAKEYCIEAQLGLFNASEINGALCHDDYWLYSRKGESGNPVYPTKAS